MKEKFAKVVRIISVPPVMALALALSVYFGKEAVFADVKDLWLTVFFLSVLPALAYPISYLLPSLKKQGREGQRNFAFLMTAVSYPLLTLYAVITGGAGFLLIAFTYLLSLVVLLLMNKGFRLRASGHACSATGPIVLICYFIGFKAILWGLLLYALIFWASLVTKRHTASELIWGSLASIIAFLLSLLLLFGFGRL
ncbi:MAG TPA: hypothetical protein PKD52_09415 [Clostridiales bacterium]|nr:hypothetical protein [Clostridiales bacterium]